MGMTAEIAHAALSGPQPLRAVRAGNGTPVAQNGSQAHAGVNPGGTGGKRKDPRKQTVAHQGGFLILMVRKFAERAKGEDPSYGLKTLLKIQRVIDEAVEETGRALVAKDGPSAVADDLTVGTDLPWPTSVGKPVTAEDVAAIVEKWSRQRVHKRWGGGER